MTCVRVSKRRSKLVEGLVVVEDPVLSTAEWCLSYDFVVFECLSELEM